MSKIDIVAVCPHCKLNRRVSVEPNGGGYIPPILVRCNDLGDDSVCPGAFVVQGRVNYNVTHDVIPIPMQKPVPAEGV